MGEEGKEEEEGEKVREREKGGWRIVRTEARKKKKKIFGKKGEREREREREKLMTKVQTGTRRGKATNTS